MASTRDNDRRTIRTLERFRAGVFDLDGVVTRTAQVHAAAWKDLFDGYLQERSARTGDRFQPFDIEKDYRSYVDGRPRYEGVKCFLESRDISLPYGSPDDAPGTETVCGLGNLKNRLFHARLERDGVDVYDSSLTLIRRLRSDGLKTALVSSSKNVDAVVSIAGLDGLFDAVVDGVDAAKIGLKGKPAPDVFLHAAKLLDVAPEESFAVEDAEAGVEAARAAGFGLVVGINRGDDEAALRAHGADAVVADLGDFRLNGSNGTAGLPNALERFDEIAQRLNGHRAAVFLDYDGTLTPIVSRPELAVLSEAMRRNVETLGGLCPVAVVSGRDRADVQRLVGLDNLVYAGSHGFDIAGPNGLSKQHERAAEYLPALDRAEAQLNGALHDVEGALVERKRFAIAVHYRLVADEDVGSVESAVDAAIAQDEEHLRKTGGKKIFELRPRLPWDKGRAVLWLLEALGLDRPEVLPFYLGDDETDEDAFAAIRDREGLGVLVAAGQQQTQASYALRNPEEVGRFIERLSATLRKARA